MGDQAGPHLRIDPGRQVARVPRDWGADRRLRHQLEFRDRKVKGQLPGEVSADDANSGYLRSYSYTGIPVFQTNRIDDGPLFVAVLLWSVANGELMYADWRHSAPYLTTQFVRIDRLANHVTDNAGMPRGSIQFFWDRKWIDTQYRFVQSEEIMGSINATLDPDKSPEEYLRFIKFDIAPWPCIRCRHRHLTGNCFATGLPAAILFPTKRGMKPQGQLEEKPENTPQEQLQIERGTRFFEDMNIDSSS